jgi:hypothetical protein
MTIVQRLLPMLMLMLLMGSLPACSGRQQHAPAIYEPAGSIERPAKELSEEKTFGDRAEEVATVLIVVGITVALIVIPIIFFF